jgi:hypothetical protein
MRNLRSALLGVAALGLGATLAPAPARAEPDAPPTPSSHLAAAQRLYKTLNLDAAMDELKEAETEARSHSDEDEIVQVLIFKGLIFAETGKATEMEDHFKRALAMRPWAEVPPDVSPRLSKKFNDARKELWGSGGQLKPPPKKKQTARAPGSTPPAPAPTDAAPSPAPAPTSPAPDAAAPAPAPEVVPNQATPAKAADPMEPPK